MTIPVSDVATRDELDAMLMPACRVTKQRTAANISVVTCDSSAIELASCYGLNRRQTELLRNKQKTKNKKQNKRDKKAIKERQRSA